MSDDRGVPPRILIVDDNPAIAALGEQLLRSEGMESVNCSGGHKALALLNAEHFDVVILDNHGAKVSGYDVLRQMRLTRRTALRGNRTPLDA